MEADRLVAVVGSREGADLDTLLTWLEWLHLAHPEAIVVSGGAPGVDRFAESKWSSWGHRVWSFRPKQHKPGSYAIEFWDYGDPASEASVRILAEHPTWANFASAAGYRDMIIAEISHKLTAWFRPGRSRGTALTVALAKDMGKDPESIFEHEAEPAHE